MTRTGKQPRFHLQPHKIVSGGQTGVDRAALDAAMQAGFEVGGWCPKGRRALDGPIAAHYPLQETRGSGYRTRTRWNVRDSDATLIICQGEPSGGTALTVSFCVQLDRPVLVHRLDESGRKLDPVLHWLDRHRVEVLNIAGPRESKAAPVYQVAFDVVSALLGRMRHSHPGE